MSAKNLPIKISSISPKRIEGIVLLLRGQKVILDFHLAELYGVPTKALNQSVNRNRERFPEDFMFQLTRQEWGEILRSQIVTSSHEVPAAIVKASGMWSQIVTTSARKRRLTNLPYAFTEQGVAMLSSVLRSPRAVLVNIEIMRTFVRLRQWLATDAVLAARLDRLEQSYDKKFKVVFEAIRELMREKTTPRRKREIGFHTIPVAPAKSIAKPQQRISV